MKNILNGIAILAICTGPLGCRAQNYTVANGKYLLDNFAANENQAKLRVGQKATSSEPVPKNTPPSSILITADISKGGLMAKPGGNKSAADFTGTFSQTTSIKKNWAAGVNLNLQKFGVDVELDASKVKAVVVQIEKLTRNIAYDDLIDVDETKVCKVEANHFTGDIINQNYITSIYAGTGTLKLDVDAEYVASAGIKSIIEAKGGVVNGRDVQFVIKDVWAIVDISKIEKSFCKEKAGKLVQ